jgi:hypothetical protein
MKTLLKTVAVAVALSVPLASTSFAAGAFDFLDHCIKVKREFAEQRQAIFAKINLAESSIDTLTTTPEFKEAWMADVRKQARPVFDEQIAPTLREMGTPDMDKAFTVWFDLEMAKIQPEDLDKQINSDFRALARDELRRNRAEINANLDQQQKELGDACKSDVGSQVLRATLAPLGWVAGNFEAAKNEKNVVTQVFHAVTGISPQAIAEHGVLGGDHSEARKLLEPVIGGPKGAIQKGIGDAARALNPANWR